MTVAADIIERARGVCIEDELDRRGIKVRGRVERVGPCPVCGGNDRFGVNREKASLELSRLQCRR